MRGKRNQRLLLGLLVLAAASLACNPITAPFYLFGGFSNPKKEPDFALWDTAKRDKKKREIKIVVLPYRGRGLSPDFFGSERTLATMFVRQLTERFEANKERIKVVAVHEVQKFQTEHPEWRSMPAHEIGKHFDADYVVDMELAELSLFERRSHGMFFNGYCRVSLTINDVEKVGQEPVFKQDFPMQYPKSGPRVADLDNSVDKFRQDFFTQVSVRLAWALTAHPTAENCECD